MKKKALFLLGILVLAIYPVCAGAVVVVPPPPVPSPGGGMNSNSMMASASHNAVSAALKLKEEAHTLLDDAIENGLDVSNIEAALAEADALLEKAQNIAIANPIPANNMAREAAQIYENAISDLKALLG
jgi:hypothetical protein